MSTTTASEAKPGFRSAKGCNALVTGSSGFVGARLVEMLLERGASTVIAFDIVAPNDTLQERFDKVQRQTGGKIIVLSGSEGDLTSDAAVEAAFTKVPKLDIVYHIGALVGPFFAAELYEQVNYKGTLRILQNCQTYKVGKLVYSSSPSTRFTGGHVAGLKEDDFPPLEELIRKDQFLALYAKSKAQGEVAVFKANSPQLMTVAVAPHQVYGPHDPLFLPKLLETCGTGRLRIFGKGLNKLSVCHVDNYCHGLLCGGDALYKGSPALAKYYVVTDDGPRYFWKILNEASMAMGFQDLYSKFHLPVWLLFSVAYVCNFLTMLTGHKFKLNPFTVKMMIIHRYFDISNAKRDLQYQPLVAFEDGWKETIEWFQQHWLPQWKQEGTSKLTGKLAGKL